MSQKGAFEGLSDEELVRLCLMRGMKDERPFHELFCRHQNNVWWICYNFTQNAQDAEDLTQDIFFKVYRSLVQFEHRSTFKTWIYRIAINTCQNENRTRQRRPAVAEAEIETFADMLPTEGTPEAMSQAYDRAAILAQVVQQLRPEEYEILHLRDLEQRPYAEIADLLGISLSAAKMRTQRARLAFQLAYRQLGGDLLEWNLP